MMDKFRVTEFMGGGEPIVTIACHKKDWVDLIEQRNEAVRILSAIVKAYQFKGHAQVAGLEIGAGKRFLEAIKCFAKSAD